MISYTFLGYTFRPRKSKDKYGRIYENFSPAVSREALTMMRQTIRSWHIQLKCNKTVKDLSNMFNPVIMGWFNYYGKFYASAMFPVSRHINMYLIRWLMRKYKHLSCHWRTIKYDNIYPSGYESLKDARAGIEKYIHKYNNRRLHSSLGYKPPLKVYNEYFEKAA